jgi:predicted nucleotidyltransferase
MPQTPPTTASPTPLPSADDLATELGRVLDGQPDVGFAYLFGSFAKGRPRLGSDVDVAVWLDETAHRDRSDRFRRRLALEALLEPELGRRVQLVILNDAPLGLTHNVLTHGRLVLRRDEPARVRHYVDHGRRWGDLEPVRRLFGRAMLQRIEEGRLGRD